MKYNEQALEYFVQQVHEVIKNDYVLQRFESEKEKLQNRIDELTKML